MYFVYVVLGTATTIIPTQLSSTNSNINSLWTYDNKWSAYSPNNAIMDIINQANITPLEIINKGQGFWINIKY